MWTCTDNSPFRVRTTLPVAPTQSPSDNLVKASNSAVIFASAKSCTWPDESRKRGEGEAALGTHQHDPSGHRDDVLALLPGPERAVAVVQRAGLGGPLER